MIKHERERARSGPGKAWLLIMLGALAFTPALMGANCSPSRPGRNVPGTICGATGGISCGIGSNGQPMLPRCINFCANQPPVASAEFARCPLDACDAARWATANVFMCPSNFSCMPNVGDPGFGNCRASGPDYGAPCEVDGDPPCPTQSYCHRFTASYPRPASFPATAQGACVLWAREGNLCNGNANTTDPTQDRRCEPGTMCLATLDAAGVPTTTRRCQRECTSDAECPCSLPNRPVSCEVSGSSIRTCSYCMPTGAECDLGVGCCDTLASCTGIQGPDVPPGTLQCCRPNSAACTTDSQCCGTSRCTGGSCQVCRAEGQTPNASGCCSGLVPITHNASSPVYPGQTICSRPCYLPGTTTTATEGSACTPAGASQGCTYTVACRPGGYDCNENPPQGATDMTCNNSDEDCDRRPDDDYVGTNCNFAPGTTMCPFGVVVGNSPPVPSIVSVNRCRSGIQSCTPVPLCRTNGFGQVTTPTGGVGALSCESRNQFCTQNIADPPLPAHQYAATDCQASERCGPTGSVCTSATPGCCAFGSGWRPCCTPDISKANICYVPFTPSP